MERITYQEVPTVLYESLIAVETVLSKSPIDFTTRELIKLLASQLNKCAYCIDMHVKESETAGETALRIYSIVAWRETPFYTDKERAVLEYTEQLTHISTAELPQDLHTSLLTFFSKEEICYLTLCITQINSWNRLMRAFNTTPGEYRVSAS